MKCRISPMCKDIGQLGPDSETWWSKHERICAFQNSQHQPDAWRSSRLRRTCPKCTMNLRGLSFQQHFLSECPRALISCPDCCTGRDEHLRLCLRSDMIRHRTPDGSSSISVCPMARFSCQFSGSYEQLGRHLESAEGDHLRLAIQAHDVSCAY